MKTRDESKRTDQAGPALLVGGIDYNPAPDADERVRGILRRLRAPADADSAAIDSFYLPEVE